MSNRQDAIEAGENRYLGSVCKNGHDDGTGHSLRITGCSTCVICSKIYFRRWLEKNPTYFADHREKLKESMKRKKNMNQYRQLYNSLKDTNENL